MKKKRAIGLAAAIVFILCACGKTDMETDRMSIDSETAEMTKAEGAEGDRMEDVETENIGIAGRESCS